MKAFGWIVALIIVVLVIWAIVASTGTTPEATQTPGDDGMTYDVTVTNTSADQPLSPGVYVVHSHDASLNFEGAVAPAELEPLAEYGSHAAFAALVETLPGVEQVITIDEPVMPGESTMFSFEAPQGADVHLSGIQMLVGTNDGYTLVDGVELTGEALTVAAQNYDAGTEENETPGGGFDAGQPDPTRGEENVENGTPTDPQAVVTLHDQITETALELSVAVR